MVVSRSRGFTLVELLVVILIVSVLASLLLPLIGQAIRAAHEAAAETLVSQLVQAVTVYGHDTAAYSPGDGSGSKDLVKALGRPGAKGMPYLAISDEMLTPEGDLINPAQADGEPPLNIIHYRNNRGRKRGADGIGRPGVSASREFDVWCARSIVVSQRPDDAWAIHRP